LPRIKLSEQAPLTESEQRLFRAEVTVAVDMEALVPGAKEEVAVVRELRQLERPVSAFKAFKNTEHAELIPEGMKGFGEEAPAAADEVCKKCFVRLSF
jgi:hypothetical protein